MATTTYDKSKVSPKTLKGMATFKQCNALSIRLCKKAKGKPDWVDRSRIRAHFLKAAADQTFTYKQASALFTKKTLPKVYRDAVNSYIKENPES